MRFASFSTAAAAGLAGVARAQQTVWGQCAGNGWTGATTCVSGTYCSYKNDWYSQCIPGTASGITSRTSLPAAATKLRVIKSRTSSTVSTTALRATTAVGSSTSRVSTTTIRAATTVVSGSSGPATFTANPNVGPGGSSYRDSAHFRVYSSDTSAADRAATMLEGAYDCFVSVLGWRSSGLSYNAAYNANGPWYKTNVYSVASLPGAAGVMHSDSGAGWFEVVNNFLNVAQVTVHEYGHALHYHQQTWVNQGRTGAWWETLANWVADTYETSDLCAASRSKYGQTTSTSSIIEVNKVIGDSFQVIVDGTTNTANHYKAWPFLTYLTNNPDSLPGLGSDAIRQLMLQYSPNSNETPLHTLARVAQGTTVATIVGKYWARMAYLDIKHPQAQKIFLSKRSGINFANVDSQGSGTYKVKSARAPRYFGSNITPLKVSAGATVSISVTADAAFTATLAVRNSSANTVRYVTLTGGSGSTTIASGEEASLIIANTPATLILYDAFALTSEVSKGLTYSFTLSGATV